MTEELRGDGMSPDARKSVNKPASWWAKRTLAALLLGGGAYLLTLIVLNYNGYCFKEERFISDQEKIRMVVERMVMVRRPFWPVTHEGHIQHVTDSALISHWIIKGHDGPIEPIFYLSADEFLARNPNCCAMVDHVSSSEGPFKPDFWSRALGDCAGGIVRVTGMFRFRDAAGKEREIRHTGETLLTNCGRGLTVPTLK